MLTELHPVLGIPPDLVPDRNQAEIFLAGGCFWGIEKILWNTPGVVATAVGYTGGNTADPTYVMVCTGTTGHAETVRVVYDREQIGDAELLSVFWQNHDPTQTDRQGNDVGSKYRSAIWVTDEVQLRAATAVRAAYQRKLTDAGRGQITTTIGRLGGPFWLAEDYHQAYLWKNPEGYCNHGFNGVACPSGISLSE